MGRSYVDRRCQRRSSSSPKPDGIITANEGDGAFFLDCLDSGVSCLLVGGELIVPNVAGAILVDDLKHPVLIRFSTVDFDGERMAVDDDTLAFARRDYVRFFFDHLVDPGLSVSVQYAPTVSRVNRLQRRGLAAVSPCSPFLLSWC